MLCHSLRTPGEPGRDEAKRDGPLELARKIVANAKRISCFEVFVNFFIGELTPLIDAKVDKDGAKPPAIRGRKACKPRASFDEMPATTHVDEQACTHAFGAATYRLLCFQLIRRKLEIARLRAQRLSSRIRNRAAIYLIRRRLRNAC